MAHGRHHHHHDHGHAPGLGGAGDRRWLAAALVVILLFMVGEVIAAYYAQSLALLTDAAHMTTDAVALGVAIAASKIAARPAKAAYTYGYARVDALSGQANGITLLLLAAWFVYEGVRRLFDPPDTEGAIVTVVALIGILVNLLATWFATRANRSSLNVRGAVAHLITDLWAFVATFVAGVVILATGWTRADAVASLAVAALMAWSGVGLVRAAGRVFLDRAPMGTDPAALGAELASVPGVTQVHDLHVWDMGAGEPALSAHVIVAESFDCHDVGASLRGLLLDGHGIRHVTLQVDHAERITEADHCEDAHGPVHVRPEM